VLGELEGDAHGVFVARLVEFGGFFCGWFAGAVAKVSGPAGSASGGGHRAIGWLRVVLGETLWFVE
jgi:hypothetical protein